MERISKLTNEQIIGIILGLSGVLVVFGLLIRVIGSGKNVVSETIIEEDLPQVSVSINPLRDIVSRVGKGGVEVNLILPSGASPHTFEPSTSDMAKMAESELVFSIGHGLDNWVSDMAESVGAEVVLADKHVQLMESEEEHEHEHEGGDGKDPHYWLNVPNVMLMSLAVKEELSSKYPNKAELFAKNQDEYARELARLDKELREQLSLVSSRKMATHHAGWSYFAKEYSFEIVAVYEEVAGVEPTAASLAAFGRALNDNGVGIVYSEPQLSSSELVPLKEEFGFNLSQLDALGGVSGRETYAELMRFNVSQIVGVR